MLPVPHVVIFGELTPQAREQYARFLLERNVQFTKRSSDGRFIANVRLQTASSKNAPAAAPAKQRERSPSSPLCRHADIRTGTVDGEVECGEVHDDLAIDASVEQTLKGDAVPLRFRPFTVFIDKVGNGMLRRTSMGTYVTNESKLVGLINHIYDSCTDDTLVNSSLPAADGQQAAYFSTFVHVYLKSRFGIRALVEQQALEMLEGLHAHSARLDVEHFALFLSGDYEAAALNFFLRARDAAQQAKSATTTLFRPTSAASARRRRSESSSSSGRQRRASNCAAALVWLTKSQIESAALQVFNSKSEDAYLQFVHRVRSYLASRQTQRPMQALLEMQEYLSLALHTFTDLQHSPPTHRTASLSSASGHQAHDGHDTADTNVSPPPSPLPPPPLPRAFGNMVQAARAKPRGGKVFEIETSQTRPSDEPAAELLINGVPSETAPIAAAGDEVQARLSSLLARMHQRRSVA